MSRKSVEWSLFLLWLLLISALFGIKIARAEVTPAPVVEEEVKPAPIEVIEDTPLVHIQFPSPVLMTTPTGKQLSLPPGHYFSNSAWAGLDAEIKKLQSQADDIAATADQRASAWRWTVGVGLAVGFGTGLYLAWKIAR